MQDKNEERDEIKKRSDGDGKNIESERDPGSDIDEKVDRDEEISHQSEREKLDYHGLGGDGGRLESKLSNFWYHHKWAVIIASFFVVVLLICGYQLITRDNPDAYIMYAGPEYFSSGDITRIKEALRSVMTDYNDDGELGITLTTLVCMTDEQINELKEEAEAESEEFYIDKSAVVQNKRQFSMEMFAGETVICLLDPSLFEEVRDAGGFMKMSELFSESELKDLPLYGDNGILITETKFGKYFTSFSSLPEDTILCVRRVSTMSAFKGKDKYNKIHDYHVGLFKGIVLFEYPEGYVIPETE